MELIIGILLGFAIGSFIGWYLRTQKAKEDEAMAARELRRKIADHQKRIGL